MIPSIIKREFASIGSSINIVWTRCDDTKFTKFIEQTCDPCFLIDFDNTYFGVYDPSIVICNNRLIYLEKCVSLCRFFHCPLIIIDHDPKPNIVSNKIDTEFDIQPVIQIATSKDIYFSWNKVHDYVLEYNQSTKNTWKNLIFNIYKQRFIVPNNNPNIDNKNENKK